MNRCCRSLKAAGAQMMYPPRAVHSLGKFGVPIIKIMPAQQCISISVRSSYLSRYSHWATGGLVAWGLTSGYPQPRSMIWNQPDEDNEL